MAALLTTNSAADERVVGVAFSTIDTLNVRLLSGATMDGELLPGQSREHQLVFSVSQITSSQRVKGSLSFTLKVGNASQPDRC